MKYQEWIFEDPNHMTNRKIDKDNKILIYQGYPRFLNLIIKNGILESKKIRLNDYSSYFTTLYYTDKITFEKSFLEYLELQKESRKKWFDQPDIVKMMYLLERIFTLNKNAHNNSVRGKAKSAFGKKSRLLQMAVDLAFKVNLQELKFFNWGMQDDPEVYKHPIILYFEIGKEQVSFHCDIETTSDLIQIHYFSGTWIGHNQDKFPMNLKKLKSLCKEHEIEYSELYNCNTNEIFMKGFADRYPKKPEDFSWYYLPEYDINLNIFFQLVEKTRIQNQQTEIKIIEEKNEQKSKAQSLLENWMCD